jgi:hypothetical protein
VIRLSRCKDSRSLDLGFGVSVVVKPLSFAIWRAASLAAESRAIQVATEKGLVEAAGGMISDIPDAHDRDGIRGLRDQFLLQGLGRHAITAWSGVASEDGSPAPVTPEAIDLLIVQHPLIAARFEIEYLSEIDLLLAEGNASGAAPRGTSAAAPHTVATAGNSDDPVPMASPAIAAGAAPIASTHP